jgi:hypothetical protein
MSKALANCLQLLLNVVVEARREPFKRAIAHDLSAGLYRLSAGAEDSQQPHREEGRSTSCSRSGPGSEDVSVGSGEVIFGEAGEPHRFEYTGEDGEDL